MNSPLPTPVEINRKSTFAESKDTVQRNCGFLENILDEISLKLSVQVLGNLEVFEHLKNKANGEKVTAPEKVEAVQAEQIDLLIKNPIKAILGRLSGLKKVINKIQQQVNQLKPEFDSGPSSDQPVSTGNISETG